MQEFVYYNEKPLAFPLSENILVTSDLSDFPKSEFIVSNSKSIHGHITANEIDFYLRNTQDSLAKQIQAMEKLYEINGIRFDMAQDMAYTQEVSNEVLLVCSPKQKEIFLKAVIPNEFNLFHVEPFVIKSISGHIGNLKVIVDDEGEEVTLNVSQIVWYDKEEMADLQSGSFDPLDSCLDDVLATLRSNIEHYEYRKFTTYDKSICQYNERREEICSKCEEVCPTVAITKDDATKTLSFSQIDCHGCGGCISVCPSGAVDYAPSSKQTIYEMAQFVKGQIPLVIPSKMDIKELNIPLKEDVLPFAIEGEKFLHEGTFLTLLQESGAQVIFYSDFLSKGSRDAISILNQIYQKKYQKDAILIAMNEEELEHALTQACFIDGSSFSFNEESSKKREIFAIRLSRIVGNDDLGVVTTGEHVHYGHVKVNEDNCTLCLACVGACNVNAIFADTSDNTLRLNPSVCTACGYCEVSCPEKDCLSIEQDVIKLNPSWFAEEILAQDELFACVECGKEFATKKAVEKIASVMAPIFKADPIKERTLYCCETCKPKIMMKSYMQDSSNYNNAQGVSL
jgi:ferredoxin